MNKKSFLQRMRDLFSDMGFSIRLESPQPRIERRHMASVAKARKGKNNLSKVRRTSHK